MPWLNLQTTALTTLCLLLAFAPPALTLSPQSGEIAAAVNAPNAFLSELRPCPAACVSHDPRDWTVYPSFHRLSFCHEPMLFDFAIHTPVDDPSKTLMFRACTADNGWNTTSISQVTDSSDILTEPVYYQSLVREVKVTLYVSQQAVSQEITKGGSSEHISDYMATVLREVQDYLKAGPEFTKNIILGYYNGVIAGIYAGEAFGKATVPLAIDHLLSKLDSDAAPATSVLQLCGNHRDKDHVFGIVLSPGADLAAIQATLVSWSQGKCATGQGAPSEISDASIWEVPQRAGGASSNSTAHVQQREISRNRPIWSRANQYCTTRKVVSGDTCTSLAQACGITLAKFNQFNSEVKCASLQVGSKVCCTAGSLTPLPYDNGTCYTYTVEPGDNCYDIGVAWSLTAADLAKFNDGSTWGWNGCGNLGAGQNICLSEGYPPIPATISNAVCGPQVPGTQLAVTITDPWELARLNACPLHACCNIWGQCGIDPTFCAVSNGTTGNPGTSKPGVSGCVADCGTAITNNDEPPATYQRVGYYEEFNWGRKCLHMRAEWSNTLGYTHIHWAFASIGEDLSVYVNDTHGQWKGFMGLKNVKKIVSFGGWGFSTEQATYDLLRKAMRPVNRAKFVSNLVAFAEKTGIDGIDIDWEYPGAPDIPGIPPGQKTDGVNYLNTLEALRSALPKKYSLSIAAPASYWYLKGFQITGIARVVDYIVYMAYDLHGPWDYGNQYAQSGCELGNCLRSHINQTEVRYALAMITKAGVPANKIFVGESSYRRSFRMAKAGCTGPECHFDGSTLAKPGRCTEAGGYLSDAEISEIIANGGDSVLTWHDDTTASDYMVYEGREWVAYMNPVTKRNRRERWKNLNFAGTIDWAVDLQEFNMADTVGPTGSYNKSSCINVFDNMIWDWINPVIDAPVGCTNIIQPSPLPNTVKRTARTTLTLVSSTSISTTVVSTVFLISEVTYEPFTIAATDTTSSTVITYAPVPRVTPSPLAFSVPNGWTVASRGSLINGPSPTTSVIGLLPGATATSTTTSTSDNQGFLYWITWKPTVSYPLPSYVTPKIVAPTAIPRDERDPIIPLAPGVIDCVGAKCTVGLDCTGDNCTRGGDCTGPECTMGGDCLGAKCIRGGTCVGPKCLEGGMCQGEQCVSGGDCHGDACKKGGDCDGPKCTKGGGCTDTLFVRCSPGSCNGRLCNIKVECPACDNYITISVHPGGAGGGGSSPPRPTCIRDCGTLPPCEGGDSSCNGACNLKRCPADRMPTGNACTTLMTANICTEIVSSTAVKTSPVTSYSTTTRTHCLTSSACFVRDATTTTTITTSATPEPDAIVTIIHDYWEDYSGSPKDFEALESSYSEWEKTAFPPATTSTKTTTTAVPMPSPTVADGCDVMGAGISVCWSKCNPANNQPVTGDFVSGDPWCWLIEESGVGALCNTVADCPSKFACRPVDSEMGGCMPSLPYSGCAPMKDTQGVCWSSCNPETGGVTTNPWKEGDPWCWLQTNGVGAMCNSGLACPALRECQLTDNFTYAGCNTDSKGST